jgi:glycosyltransferase involved in cell wall biosynthesis
VKILLIAPFPPPVTGHSLAAQTLREEIERKHEVATVDLSKDGFTHGVNSIGRVRQIGRVLRDVRRRQNEADVIYLTIAESVAGNLKDVCIYSICFRRLSRVVVHLHGGSLKKLLFDRHPWLQRINAFFLRRVGAVVILGESHREIFAGVVSPDRIRIVANSVPASDLQTEEGIQSKFAESGPLRFLFLGNLIEGKGHNDLLDAFAGLSEPIRNNVQLDFAGAFETDSDRRQFLTRLQDIPNVRYHGVVQGSEKKALLSTAHVLCLPTTLFEGQPLSILEAYASGCAVLTTNIGGIPDIFAHGRNGWWIEQSSPSSIRAALEMAVRHRAELSTMARSNLHEARSRYSTAAYRDGLLAIFGEVSSNSHRPA